MRTLQNPPARKQRIELPSFDSNGEIKGLFARTYRDMEQTQLLIVLRPCAGMSHHNSCGWGFAVANHSVFSNKDPTGNSGTDYDILNSQCRVDEYGSAIKEANCFSHYFKIDDFFTQYFSVDGAFKVKDSYIQDGTVLPLRMKLSWLGRKSKKRNLQIRWVLSMLKA